ncbi:STAS-like domain-containing protein [Robbsia sp. Bb-Pol-6]|uniref:STAS-like domain-containing protein n=1 Tax=Robbsia betulipollinis TaxID=2981849 RepID=A0ABT3ZUG9_9BURK|nr:STAS-like domain-containing protein [Robbsia betulipollinis]
MVIRALDLVKHCYSNEDGHVVYDAVLAQILHGQSVVVSFEGVDTVPSSFVNSAFIALLEKFPFEQIKQNLSFKQTTPQINEMIRSRFSFEANRRYA